jgi:hypothetical protein
MFLGAPGSDEAYLRPQVGSNAKGGSLGPPQRRASKKRARAAASGVRGADESVEEENDPVETGLETPHVGASWNLESTGRISSDYASKHSSATTEKELLDAVRAMEGGMKETIILLREMVAIDRDRASFERSRVDLETSKVQLSSLKVQIASFPLGSAAHTRALESLEKYANAN